MYLARRRAAGRAHYSLRETYRSGDDLLFREVFDLGPEPARFIVYPGGNAFYVDPDLEETLRERGFDPGHDELEDLLWPFVHGDIRWKLEPFRRRQDMTRRGRAPAEAAPLSEPHVFDRRRLLFLKSGRMDQRAARLPASGLRALQGRSRDEIEQMFLEQETVLRPRELKTYTFTIFDLQQAFHERCARETPEFLDPDRLDEVFVDALCRLQEDAAFWGGMDPGPCLNEYLARYAVMFFDYAFESLSPEAAYIRDFINRHRDHRPPESVAASLQESADVFGETRERLRGMTARELTRLYRRRAQELHPDKGGDHERFVKLAKFYERLMRTKR